MVAPTRARVIARTARPTPLDSMIGLQRSAGNGSTLALLRRGRGTAAEAPVTLSLPSVSEHVAVSAWSVENDLPGRPTALHITRPTDSDSPALAKALTDGAPGVTATLLVRKLTPLGWVRDLRLTLQDCMVSSYLVGDDSESLGLTFTAMRAER